MILHLACLKYCSCFKGVLVVLQQQLYLKTIIPGTYYVQ